MARLNYLLGFAIVAWTVVTEGQEPVLTAPPLPPATAVDVPGQDWFAEPGYSNCYPMYRCEAGNCCNQWWCEGWYGRVELLTLARNYTSPNRTIVSGSGGVPAFTTDDIGFKVAPGISTLLGHRINGDTSLELVYFGANQWNLDRAFVFVPATIDVSLRSQLHNAEVNYLHDLPNVSLLAGFRYLYFGEQFRLTNNAAGAAATLVSNNFSGGQLGFRTASYWHGLDWETTGKAGLYGNQATAAESFRNGTGTINSGASMTNATLAFISDLSVAAACPITRHCRLRAGYNLLYASGLALAANQPSFFVPGPRRVQQDADVFLHGFNVGVEAVW